MLKYEDVIFNADSIEECRKLLYSDVFKNNYWSTVQRYWEEGFIRPAEDTVNKPEDLYMYRLLCRCNRDESGITQYIFTNENVEFCKPENSSIWGEIEPWIRGITHGAGDNSFFMRPAIWCDIEDL